MTTLGVIGDLHGQITRLDRVIDALAEDPPDGVLLVGDFASGRWERSFRWSRDATAQLQREVDDVLRKVRGLGVPVAWVAGNHDMPDLDGPGCADRRLLEIAELRVFGIGGAGPARFGFPYEWPDKEIAAIDVPACDVLLCHAPPRGTLDRTVSGTRAGSRAIQSHAHRAAVLVCGHIHEAAGLDRIGDTVCLNAGSLGEPFPRPQVGRIRFDGDEVEVELHTLDDDQKRTLRHRRRHVD